MAVDYGRPPSLARNDYGYIAPGQLRGATFAGPSQHLWAYELWVWSGKHTAGPDGDPDNVTLRLAIHDVDGSLNPTTRRGYTNAATVSNVMNDQSAGQPNGGPVAVVDVDAPTGVTFSAIPLQSGQPLHLDFLGTVGSLGHAMAQASVISAPNEKFYNRSGLAQPPPDPFGSYTASIQGHPAAWAVCDANAAPDVPTGLAPVGTINDTAPTFEAAFNDANENRGDYLNQFRIQVRRKSDGVTFWDAILTSNEAERTADAFERAYAGTTLVRGVTYQQRVQMSDHFNAWSDWTAWTDFTPVNLGFVTLNGAPTGKVEDNTPDFQGRWTHQAATTMKTVQVRILNGAGTTVLQTGADYNIADVASSASPGTLFTVPWANTGLSTLAWGTAYRYQVRGYDGSQWSDWSAARSFSTNAAPAVPSGLQPNNSAIPLTSYPLLTCVATDADDTTASGLAVSARIKSGAGAVLFTRTMAYNATTGRWEYQTTATDLATYDDYRWDAYSYDGTLYSGEKTSSATATKSAEAVFDYVDGPEVTVTSPTVDQVLTSSDLAIAWTISAGTQVSVLVRVYDDADQQVIGQFGELGSPVQNMTITDHPAIRNGESYTLTVEVVTDAPLFGYSEVVPFSVAYTPPDQVANVAASPEIVTTDIWPSAIRVNWDQTGYGSDVWRHYQITYGAASGSDTDTRIVTITSPTQTSFTYYVPASGPEYWFRVTQAVYEGVETIVSVPVEVRATVDLGGVVLCSVADPVSLRTTLRHTAERDYPRDIDAVPYYPSSGADPTTVRGRRRVVAPSFDVRLFDDAGATVAVRREELEALDIEGGTLCYRDNHGRKLFVTMPEMTIGDRLPDWHTARIELRTERYEEGSVQTLIDVLSGLLGGL